MKTFFATLLCILLIIGGFFALSKFKSDNTQAASIIATNFIGYDLARAITGNSGSVELLLKPGSDMHSFEPTPQDIIDISNADLFIYNGGESEEWVDRLLADNNIPREKTLRLMDFVNLKTEELTEGMESDETEDDSPEYDEHIWTSPKNTVKLLAAIRQKLSEKDPENSEKYQTNADQYAVEIIKLDQSFRDLATNNKTLIFADRFPFRYFVDEYGFEYFAAFPGCSEQTEASSGTVAFLVDKVKSENLKTIFKTEFTSDKLARTISEATGAEVKELNAAHNISSSDFESGITFVDIMKNNLKILTEFFNS